MDSTCTEDGLASTIVRFALLCTAHRKSNLKFRALRGGFAGAIPGVGGGLIKRGWGKGRGENPPSPPGRVEGQALGTVRLRAPLVAKAPKMQQGTSESAKEGGEGRSEGREKREGEREKGSKEGGQARKKGHAKGKESKRGSRSRCRELAARGKPRLN